MQRSSRSCSLRSSTSSTSRGCSGPCFVLALCMLALCALAPPMLALRVPAVRALALHACVVRTCASHARVACTCCACPRCACPRRAPSCWACGVLVQRSPTSCGLRSSTSPTPLSAQGAEPSGPPPSYPRLSLLPSLSPPSRPFNSGQCLSMRGFFICPVLLLNTLYR